MRFDRELDEYLIAAVARNDSGSVQHLVMNGANINMRTNCHGDRLLHMAAERNLPDIVHTLVMLGQKTDITNDKGETPLFTAIRRNRPEMISLLARNGANLDHEDPYGVTPLIYAACIGHDDNFAQLICLGANKNYKNRQGMTVHIFANNPALQNILDGSDALVTPASLLAFLNRRGRDLPPPQYLP